MSTRTLVRARGFATVACVAALLTFAAALVVDLGDVLRWTALAIALAAAALRLEAQNWLTLRVEIEARGQPGGRADRDLDA